MKKQICNWRKNALIPVFVLLFFCLNCNAQFNREVTINTSIDTASVDFQLIFNFWEKYMDDLLIESSKSDFLMRKMDKSLKCYWDKHDTTAFLFPDLYYSFASSYGNVFYPLQREHFLGIAKRDTNLFEIRTIFYNRSDNANKAFPSIMFSVPVIKEQGNFHLMNKFTLNQKKLLCKKYQYVNYYYSSGFPFNDEQAKILQNKIKDFLELFQLDKPPVILYLLGDNLTEISSWMGINYFEFDYNIVNRVEGRACKNSNIILSAGGGEAYFHEVIHVLLKNITNGHYHLFEEGTACFFGGHVGENYHFHVQRLKRFLEDHKTIDLSNNLNLDSDPETNYSYILHAVVCDIAYRSGTEAIKDLLLYKTDTQDDFYKSIEQTLGIKRSDMNSYIRKFISGNY